MALFGKKNSQLSEAQILKKIDAWDDQDKIKAIIDFVEPLSDKQKTPKVLSELARAYNNMYWLQQTQENAHWLRKAIDVFMNIKPHMEGHDLAAWHFRIAWSYFYLGDADNAQHYFARYLEMSNCPQDEVPTYLNCIALANAENQRRNCAQIYNEGNIAIADRIWFMQKALADYAPLLFERLGEAASEAEISAFEAQFGAELPEAFKALHRAFSGQKDDAPFLTNNERWIALADIPALQAKIVAHLEEHFGKDWQSIKMPEYNSDDEDDPANENATFFSHNFVKNRLYSHKWLPVMANDEVILCLDTDPVDAEATDQILIMLLGKSLEEHYVSVFVAFDRFIMGITDNLQSGSWQYDAERNALKNTDSEDEGFSPIYSPEEEQAFISDCEAIWGRVGKIIPDPRYKAGEMKPKCDILAIYPDSNDPEDDGEYALITCGVGAIPMDDAEPPFTELAIHLPSTWNPDSTDPKDTAPIDWLREVADLVFNGSTIDTGHTVPIDEMIGTDFTGVMLWKASSFDENDERSYLAADLPSGKTVSYLSLVPLYQSEMDYRLEHGSSALADKLFALPMFPVTLDPNRPNTCEGFVASSHPHALDDIAWAFTHAFFGDLSEFGQAVQSYNADIDKDLSDYNPFVVLFDSKTVKFVYEAWLHHADELNSFETLDPEIFNQPSEDGLYQAEIIATATANGDKMLALEFLQWVNNTLHNKELGDHIFFEGIEFLGRDDNGVPVVQICLGS